MKRLHRKAIIPILAIFLLTSCGNLNSEVENKLNELENKTANLDSLINKEVDKVLTLDSLINKESEKVKKLDTLLNKSSSQLDSIAKKGSRLLKPINN